MVREEILARSSTGSELQQEILSDGFVTDAEADQAASALVECAAEKDVRVTPIQRDEGLGFEYYGRTLQDPMEAMDIFTRCENAEYLLVGQLLGVQRSRSPEDEAELAKLVTECLLEAGIPVGQWPNVDVEPDPSTEATCVDEAELALQES